MKFRTISELKNGVFMDTKLCSTPKIWSSSVYIVFTLCFIFVMCSNIQLNGVRNILIFLIPIFYIVISFPIAMYIGLCEAYLE